MTATNHGLAGAAIAISLQEYPVIAITLAFASHFILDSFPHFGDDNLDIHSRKFYTILGFDMALAVASTLALAWAWPHLWWLLILCAFLAASPDLAWLYYRYLRPHAKLDRLSRFHSWIQWYQKPPGAVTEFAWYIVLFPALLILGS